jgi:hypothetical protein
MIIKSFYNIDHILEVDEIITDDYGTYRIVHCNNPITYVVIEIKLN